MMFSFSLASTLPHKQDDIFVLNNENKVACDNDYRIISPVTFIYSPQFQYCVALWLKTVHALEKTSFENFFFTYLLFRV